MGEGAGAVAHPRGDVVGGALGDAGEHRELHQLQVRGPVGAAGRAVPRAEHPVGGHGHPVELGGAAGGEALAEAVPVVVLGHALGVGVDEHRDPLTVLVGGDDDVVRVEAAGAVVLGAAEAEVRTVRRHGRAVAVDGPDPRLADGVADETAVGDRPQPALPLGSGLREELLLDEPPVHPQRLRQVRLRRGQVRPADGTAGAPRRRSRRAPPARAAPRTAPRSGRRPRHGPASGPARAARRPRRSGRTPGRRSRRAARRCTRASVLIVVLKGGPFDGGRRRAASSAREGARRRRRDGAWGEESEGARRPGSDRRQGRQRAEDTRARSMCPRVVSRTAAITDGTLVRPPREPKDPGPAGTVGRGLMGT